MTPLQIEARLPLVLAVRLHNHQQFRTRTTITAFLQPIQGFSKLSWTKKKAQQDSKNHLPTMPFLSGCGGKGGS